MGVQARIVRDMGLGLSIDQLCRAAFFIVVITTVNYMVLQSCTQPDISCPTDPALDSSFSERKSNLTNGRQKECVSEVINYRNLDQTAGYLYNCSSHVECSYDGNGIVWLFEDFDEIRDTFAVHYAISLYNDKMLGLNFITKEKEYSDFVKLGSALKQAEVPISSVICVEESWDNVLTKPYQIARGRCSEVEQLRDFGIVASVKEVTFVTFGANCPDPSTTGVLVYPYDVTSTNDLEYWNVQGAKNAPAPRRFSITVPDRAVGRSYFSMCERAGWDANNTTATWRRVENSVYTFGDEAVCGDYQCDHADFTSKMTNSLVSRAYFSIITFTTVGFGDISPMSRRAQLVVCLTGILLITSANYI